MKASQADRSLFPSRVLFAGSSPGGGGTEAHAQSWLHPATSARTPVSTTVAQSGTGPPRALALNLAQPRPATSAPHTSPGLQAAHHLSPSHPALTACLPEAASALSPQGKTCAWICPAPATPLASMTLLDPFLPMASAPNDNSPSARRPLLFFSSKQTPGLSLLGGSELSR